MLQLDAANVEANFMMAEYYEGERDWPRMLGHLEQVVKSDAGNVAARLKIAKLMLMKNELDGAAQQVAAVEAQEPDNAQAMMLRGVLLVREGDQKGGLEQAKRAYLADTSDIEIVGAYASMLMATGNAGEATEVILQALESRPDDNTLGVLLFQAYAAQDRRGEAAEVLIATARRDPHSLPNWRILAAYQARNGDFEAAEAVLREMNTANPDSVEAKLTLASFLGQRDEQAAVDVLKQFIADAPAASSELKFALGEAYLRGKSLDEASEQFQDIVASSSSPTQVLTARNQLARIALRQNRNDEAAAIVEEVLATDPRNRDALLARAAIALAANRADDAIIDLRTVWQDHPDSDQTLVLMAQAYMQNSAEDLAERSLMEALKINPLNERAALGSARIRLARQDHGGRAEGAGDPVPGWRGQRGCRCAASADPVEPARLARRDQSRGRYGGQTQQPRLRCLCAGIDAAGPGPLPRGYRAIHPGAGEKSRIAGCGARNPALPCGARRERSGAGLVAGLCSRWSGEPRAAADAGQ